jgi:hypothetical protein
MPLRLRVEIERELITAGYLTGKPEGYLGPQARAALKAWVEAKGSLGPDPAAVAPLVEAPPAPPAPGEDGGNPNNVTVSLEDGERVARHVTGLIQNARTVEEWRRALGLEGFPEFCGSAPEGTSATGTPPGGTQTQPTPPRP